MSMPTLVIGKNGKTGRRVDTLLQIAGYRTRAVSRSTDIAFDWQQPEGWLEAMQGCGSAYVCFQPDLAVPAASHAIAEFIRLARQAGIRHIVLLSGRGEAGAQHAERLVMASGLEWNIVRASWFAQNFSEGILIDGVLNGQVVLPAGDIPEPFVDTDDIAAVAFACLTQPALVNQVFEVTGPQLLTLRDCVDVLSDITGNSIEFVPVSAEDFLQGLRQQGQPEDVLWLMNELFTVVMDGRNSRVANGVEKALGRPATSFRDYALKAARAGAWASPAAVATV
ncbi:NmrA family transcriptional regulator [Marinobacterium rhizophilum]|uniref:NmrA family transcriptional regulator n=1 Tax=Marinobacterium rhizophilum TaxID=420402 RepID=A0ABY5HKG8_9GAMM|nr:NmrA family transcriptional regulator [Marinobacterium rhizophilum]UTW12790.1 NmrA family transcriptional regulator [Marinobacterium rhizophilum]